ncbi:hypothetical protein AcW1_006935 [Taiwanofungus camphoratus]|nr:hypothetical protein AcW1_006935 [Antrodia cinnamomea]
MPAVPRPLSPWGRGLEQDDGLYGLGDEREELRRPHRCGIRGLAKHAKEMWTESRSVPLDRVLELRLGGDEPRRVRPLRPASRHSYAETRSAKKGALQTWLGSPG